VIKSKLGEPGMDDEKQGSHIAVQSAYLPISASTSRIVDASNSISFAASRLCWLVLVLELTLSPPSPKSIFRGIGFAVDSLNPLFLFFFLNLITSSLVIYAPSALVGRSRALFPCCLPFVVFSLRQYRHLQRPHRSPRRSRIGCRLRFHHDAADQHNRFLRGCLCQTRR